MTVNNYTNHKLIVLDHVEVNYIDEGVGNQTLFFIHGLATNLTSWQLTIPFFTSQYRCIALDLPIVEDVVYESYAGKISFYAELIAAVIHQLNLNKVYLIGHSMGGQISIMVALKFPSLIHQLVLLAPAGFETFSDSEKKMIAKVYQFDAVYQATEEQIRQLFKLNFYEMPTAIEPLILDRLALINKKKYKAWCRNLMSNVQGMLAEPVWDQLGQVEQRTLVIYGEEDYLIPNQVIHSELTTNQIAWEGYKKLQDAELHIIPKCGHFLQFESPTIINEIISFFLA